MEYLKLNNGMMLPQVGLGTWQVTRREVVNDVISNAYHAGYRLFDIASAYCNEIAIAKAVAAAEIQRDKIYLSDKVWNTNRGYFEVQDACKKSLLKLKTEYLDVYLIHWPASMRLYENWKEINADTWRGMEKLYKDGLVRSIGVCNFLNHHLEELLGEATIKPMINQIEIHPGKAQKRLVDYCKENDIAIEASSPLGNGQILENKQLAELADKKGKTVAQICLRWAVQKQYIVIPKTINCARMNENISIFDFQLSNEEMTTIDAIPYCGGLDINPDEVVDFG